MGRSAGKEDPVEFDSSLSLSGDIGGVVIGGRLAGSEKPLLLSLLCKSNGEAKVVMDYGFL